MRTDGKREVLGKIARRGLLLAALLAFVLTCATTSRAQSGATATSAQDTKLVPATAVPAQTPTTTVKPVASPATAKSVTTAANAPTPAQEKPPARGQREGITVHGHWTIEVRNPDGKVVTHREFENSLLDHAGVLGGLLGHASTAGGLSITLLGTCGFILYPAQPGLLASNGPGCVLYESDSPLFTAVLFSGLASTPNSLGINDFGYGVDCSGGNPNCYGVLSASYTHGSDALTLQGTAQLPATGGTGSISAVYANIYTCPASTSPSNCVTVTPTIFTTLGPYSGSFALTGTTLPSSVPVSGGQSVFVTVQISFSSK